MTAIDERAREIGAEKLGAPLTEEYDLGGGRTERAYYYALLRYIPGAGVYLLPEGTVADRFLGGTSAAPLPPIDPTAIQEAIDVASYQPRDLTALINGCSPRPQHVVVHLYMGAPYESVDQDHTREQIYSAQDCGCSVGGYYFGYPGNDPRESVKRALGVADSAGGFHPPVLWLDVETSDWGLVSEAWIEAALDETRKQGAVPGIYTAAGMWSQVSGQPDFREVHLWNAWWNEVHNLVMLPYGGWHTPSAGHQWGVVANLDRNVFAAAVTGA